MAENSTQNQDKFVLRFPHGMRERIKAEAANNNRSMNAEIIQAMTLHLDSADYNREMDEARKNWVPLQDDEEAGMDVGFLPATKRDLDATIKKIEELIDNKLKEFK